MSTKENEDEDENATEASNSQLILRDVLSEELEVMDHVELVELVSRRIGENLRLPVSLPEVDVRVLETKDVGRRHGILSKLEEANSNARWKEGWSDLADGLPNETASGSRRTSDEDRSHVEDEIVEFLGVVESSSSSSWFGSCEVKREE